MKLHYILRILQLAAIVAMATTQDSYEALLCENSGRVPLVCPDNKLILASSAFFGREDYNTTCSHPTAVGLESCSSDTATEIFKQMCEGKNRCEIDARTEYFGDPCPGNYKYLKVAYTCVDCVNQHSSDTECEFWEMFGQCANDEEWMFENCRKSCWQCDPSPPTCENVFKADDECVLWAARGECASNPAWMNIYCRKSCQRCDKRTDCSVNKYDVKYQQESCGSWFETGECSLNAQYMLRDCTKSCFGCQGDDVIKCFNKHDGGNDAECDEWAAEGECKTNPGYMIPYCFKSCMGCNDDPPCVNVDPDDECERRADNGDCATDPENMYKNCWKSCMNCKQNVECVNAHGNDIECDYWAKKGECEANSRYMMSNCTLSCTKCKPSAPQSKECVNLLGYDNDCNGWALNGECHRNPGWMFSYCREACTLCNLDVNLTKIGMDPFTGLMNVFSRQKTMVLPDEFPVTAQLTHFIAYFGSSDPIYLQVWRPASRNTFDLVYSRMFTPRMTKGLETILTDRCVNVQQGDRIGFTFRLRGPSPLFSKFDMENIKKLTSYRSAMSSGSFINIRYPYVFSLAAGYDDATLCPDN